MTALEPIDASPERQPWEQAGEAWGHRADDWSCLYEHYSIDVMLALFAALRVGRDLELLDVACGSGLAVRLADAMGATVSGIDAASELIAIARARTPGADLRLGSMFDMPWSDASFDAVISINGIWGGCDAAVGEAYRVLRPGGVLGISFWGFGPPLDLRACFKVFAAHSPEEHLQGMRSLNNIAVPGVAEDMLGAAGFVNVERGSRVSVLEWPDAEIAWRGVTSMGPAVPALRHADLDLLKRDVLAALASCRDDRGMYRFRNDHQFVLGHKPS